MNRQNNKTIHIALILLLFFMSGALALTYQVVWSRMMMHIFGSTAIAIGTVLAAFMTGMAIGSFKIGPIADRSANGLRLYAGLEVAIALTALVSHLLLSQINPAHEAVFRLLGSSAANFGLMRFILAFLLVLMPTVLMGATLPVLASYLVDSQARVGVKISTLYASNTIGAVAGVLLTGFFLIGHYGIHMPVYMAVCGNLVIGGIAWLISLRIPGSISNTSSPAAVPPGREVTTKAITPGPAMIRIILSGLALSGFTSFAYEIYWTRSLVFILGNSTYALTTMLSAFLTGIALGGYLIRFFFGRIKDSCALFGWIQVLLGVFSALALPLLFSVSDPQALSQYLLASSGQIPSFIFAGFGVAFLVMLVPAMFIGATFPLAGHIGVMDVHRTGSSIGRIYAINTMGNVLGALLPGVILLNWLGIQKGIMAMATLNAFIGFIILFLRLTPSSRHPAWRLVLPLLVVVTVATMSRVPLHFQFPSEGELNSHQTLFYREGPSATTKVFFDPQTKNKHMSVDGIIIGGTGMIEFKQLLLAHLPKLLLDSVANELSVGIGSGILMGESFLHPDLKTITAVEIEPGVVEGARLFREENHLVFNNPGLDVVIDDIGNFLRTTTDTYKVITADEKTADEYASNGFSYSLEYYELLNQHLEPDGLVAQWIPSTLPPEQYQMILKTFAQSFAHVQLWYFLPAYQRGPFNSILIGSRQELAISYHHINQQLAENRDVYQSLERYGLTSAEAILPHFVADGDTIRMAVNDAAVNSLDHPRYEFYYPWDYATEKQNKFISNHRFIMKLRQAASADFLAGLEKQVVDSSRLKSTFGAENIYLSAFEKYLTGMNSITLYSMFDYVLSLAPWNDSLRARIYSLYAHAASTPGNPAERARLMKRANMLYETREGS